MVRLSTSVRSGAAQAGPLALVTFDLSVIARGTGGADKAEASAVGALLVALALAGGVVNLALAFAGGTRPFEHRPVILDDDQLPRAHLQADLVEHHAARHAKGDTEETEHLPMLPGRARTSSFASSQLRRVHTPPPAPARVEDRINIFVIAKRPDGRRGTDVEEKGSERGHARRAMSISIGVEACSSVTIP